MQALRDDLVRLGWRDGTNLPLPLRDAREIEARVASLQPASHHLLVGLMSYGIDTCAYAQRALALADKVLRGTPPGDIPIEQPTRVRLVWNQGTARAIGLTIPQSLLLRADEVIE